MEPALPIMNLKGTGSTTPLSIGARGTISRDAELTLSGVHPFGTWETASFLN